MSIVNLSITLQSLGLDGTGISGSIPSAISNLVGIESLGVSNTYISGLIPESIGRLVNLGQVGLFNTYLSGPIPSSIGNLSMLAEVYASNANLSGAIPASIGRMTNLFLLELSQNHLSGSIPTEIFKLPALSFLNLSYNALSGPLPSEVGSSGNLENLALSGNQLSYEIPDSIGGCIVLEQLLLDNNAFEGRIPNSLNNLKGLTVLNLSMNMLSGTIPDGIGSIQNLQQLFLAHNNLSGMIPIILQNMSSLSELDLSFNNLQGEVPTEGIFRILANFSIAGNHELCGGIPQLHLAQCHMDSAKNNRKGKPNSGNNWCTIFLSFASLQLIYKKLRRKKSTLQLPTVGKQYERVSYEAIADGTNGFSEANLLGKGSFGMVYKCTFQDDGTIAAVKVFNLEQSGSTRSFVTECEALRTVRHRCLIKIITCCSSINNHGQEFKALVFEFMPNGSLCDWLHPKSGMPTVTNTLSLAQRLDISVDIMDALDYLHNHCQPSIIHCDLKPSNILLAEDMSARVGDFGISRILPERASKTPQNSNSIIGIRGSIGYVAPEYGEGSFVSTLGDVYSLGILLLEVFTGRSPTDDMFRGSLDLHKFSADALPERIWEVVDTKMWLHTDPYDNTTRSRIEDCLVAIIALGISCSKKQPRERISIQDAIIERHAIRDSYLINNMVTHPVTLVPSILFTLMITTASASISNNEAAALLEFRAGFNNHNSSMLASWNHSASVCVWEGVACNSQRPPHVVALSLPFHGIAGKISPVIGNLTYLQMLNLSSNRFYGEIPPSIGRLIHLQTLDMGNNLLSGMIPANLTFCTSLTTLILEYNRLSGQIPNYIGSTLTHLLQLSLMNNTFTGPVPESLGNLSSLRAMSLRENWLQGPIPASLGNLNSLQFLNLENNGLSGEIPLSLYNLSTLTDFDVGGNNLHGHIPVDIGEKFPRIEVFSLGANRFSGAIPSSICNLTALTRLYLSQNRFSGFVPPTMGMLQYLSILFLHDTEVESNDREGWEFIASMANCSQLEILLIGNNSFSGQLPSSIANLSSTLEYLYLGYNNITGSIPLDIGNLASLSILEIEHTFMSGVIPDSIGRLVNLVQLGLDNNRLSGLIPPSVGNLTQLEWLLASKNNLEGPIPTSLGKLKNLDILDLSANYNLNGTIPREILVLTFLSSYLDLSYNSLSGPLPAEVGGLSNLNKLVLSANQLSGEIPDSIGNCAVLEFLLLDRNSFEGSMPHALKNVKGLRILNLTMNKLSDAIPDTVGSISGLEQLYLAHNNFSGEIPAVIQNLTLLSRIDVSFNNLQGEVPKGGVFRNLTYLSIAGNDNLCGGIPQLHLAPCPMEHKGHTRKERSKSLTVALTTTGAILLLVSLIVLIQLISKKIAERQKAQVPPVVIEETYQKVSYYELSRGTKGFSEDNLLGKGRYGAVYKCTFNEEHESITMAVKVFNLQQSGSSRSFEAECEALSSARHRCLVKIITCCSSINPQGQEFKALVFEFMPNGTLDDWLHPKSENYIASNTLSLAQRLDIAVDIVDAIDYLHNHCDPQIIHCDLKPSNILLAEDMTAKVGDFGISKVLSDNTICSMQNSNSTIGIRGSIGYVPPEYGEGSAVSTTGDLYSLGILLLEMFTGLSPTDGMFRDSLDLHKFAEEALSGRTLDIADPKIWLHVQPKDSFMMSRIEDCLISVFRLAISCSKQHPRDRMMMNDAAIEMHTIRDSYL
ncbi:hypothetical protein U9M48_037026, partial [Paspalum notatum var. saurae]